MSIDNSQDVVDSRDVVTRLAELAGQWADHENDPEMPALDEDEREELKALTALNEQGESVDDWEYGATLVRESYFEDYARELAEDIGAIPSDVAWPCTCIDWERAARELSMDYTTTIEWDGVTYYVR